MKLSPQQDKNSKIRKFNVCILSQVSQPLKVVNLHQNCSRIVQKLANITNFCSLDSEVTNNGQIGFFIIIIFIYNILLSTYTLYFKPVEHSRESVLMFLTRLVGRAVQFQKFYIGSGFVKELLFGVCCGPFKLRIYSQNLLNKTLNKY